MRTAPTHLDGGDEEAPGLGGLARRRMAILCVVYLILLAAEATRFLFADFPDLAAAAEGASLAFEATQAIAAASEDMVIEAASRLDTARAGVLRGWARLGGLGLAAAVVGYFLGVHRRRLGSRLETVNALTLMIVLVGGLLLASRLALQSVIPSIAVAGMADLVVMHLAACLIVPWNTRESSLPFAPLLLLWSVAFLVPNASTLAILDRVVIAMISPLLFVPGGLIARWLTRRREEDKQRLELVGQVASFGGELSRARIVHDAMFPDPFTGHVAFEYEYQPIQEIGGDYVHAYVCPETGKVTLTLLDVAGHGLAAALTVNRLFGELERILAENAAAEPAEVMLLLNRYINLTMSRHSLFATGTCMMLDPSNGELKWVNAGHPPSIVRHPDGRLHDLPTTTVLLGVLDPEAFAPEPQTLKLSPGDVVIAYTDGAFEARDPSGSRFGLDRVREIARFDPPPRHWPRFIASAVSQHHAGNAEDDVLIAALTLKSLRVGSEPVARGDAAPVAVKVER